MRFSSVKKSDSGNETDSGTDSDGSGSDYEEEDLMKFESSGRRRHLK